MVPLGEFGFFSCKSSASMFFALDDLSLGRSLVFRDIHISTQSLNYLECVWFDVYPSWNILFFFPPLNFLSVALLDILIHYSL